MRNYVMAIIAVGALSAPVLAVQSPQRGEQEPRVADAIGPAELQRMFDAYALMQAQDQLKIKDDQYSQFLTRFKALQDIRRRSLQERMRLLQSLRKMLNGAQPADEAQLKEQLKALDDLETRAAADVKKAHDAVDQVLDTAQQAKFRVFEENMERRKLELLTRARQANRPKKQL
jgi:Spy/CpxP family protein refolding chaperone